MANLYMVTQADENGWINVMLERTGNEAETGLFDVDQVRTKKEAWAAIDTSAKETAHYERAPHEYTVTVDE